MSQGGLVRHAAASYPASAFTAEHRRAESLQQASGIISRLAASLRERGVLAFHEVGGRRGLAQVGQFRLRCYRRLLPYMVAHLDDRGFDTFDARSRVLASWWNDEVVATVRLTPWPFETETYVPQEWLHDFLGENWCVRYVEFSGLLVDQDAAIPLLMPALLTFAFAQALDTSYQGLVGYSKDLTKSAFRSFGLAEDTRPFSIGSRGHHSYFLMRGDLDASLEHALHGMETRVAALEAAAAGGGFANPAPVTPAA